MDRARDRQFDAADGDAPSIGRICRRLDGMPLAIELAAARLATDNLAQIDGSLDDRFALLTDGSRTALPRHRTLEAAIDWSHGLLTADETLLFRRLAVFRGGWTAEAAEGVCADDRLPARDFPRLLGSLAHKSLVSAERPSGAVRYRLLETVRAFASERLDASGEAASVRARHTAWHCGLVERAWPELISPAEMAWLARLEANLDNLRAALSWCRAEGRDLDAALRLAGGLTFLWVTRGAIAEGWAQLEAVLADTAAPCEPAARARARSPSEEALDLRRALGPRET